MLGLGEKEKPFTPDDLPDLSGRVVFVTGGNAGLGKQSILAFVKKGAKVYMACRSEDKANAAIAEIKGLVSSAEVHYISMDLSSLSTVVAAANAFQARESRLHILLNNAGIMATPYGTTANGFELQLGTNYVGHFLLTKLLTPMLITTAKEVGQEGVVRVVNLGSIAHSFATVGIDFDDMHHENGRRSEWTRYGVSKLACILHAKSLAERLSQYGIFAVSVHPGVIATDLYNHTSSASLHLKLIWKLAACFMVGVEKGAYTQIYCCAAEGIGMADSGAYFVPVGKKEEGSKFVRDEVMKERLWEWTEEELRKLGY